ncbi:hypothetical protein CHS0354_016579 [Potamilus streckersoni]|uniref:Uncharacterized protein n=1 Tax=Potamilus streckersoni TaxID=2493646 RepID=A0AAE0TKW4_9BIVA|nr:hypothetical protein CHS0354_016579 [Potamilus streckersoni]
MSAIFFSCHNFGEVALIRCSDSGIKAGIHIRDCGVGMSCDSLLHYNASHHVGFSACLILNITVICAEKSTFIINFAGIMYQEVFPKIDTCVYITESDSRCINRGTKYLQYNEIPVHLIHCHLR